MSEDKIFNESDISQPDTDAAAETEKSESAVPDTENITADNDISDLEAAERVDEILKYYKDIPFDESKSDETDIFDEDVEMSVFDKFKNRLFPKKDTPAISKQLSADEYVHESSYGIPDKAKPVITYAVTAAVCAVIIGGAFFIAYTVPKNDDALNAAADVLRNADDYKSVKSEFDSLSAEVDELRQTVSEKEENVEKVTDYENTRAELREMIKSKQEELNQLNTQNNDLQTQIDNLNTGITEKSGGVKELSPGKYTVGSEIAPGKYSVVGTGKLVIASSESVNKFNEILTATPVEITLESGDKLTLESNVKFTFIN